MKRDKMPFISVGAFLLLCVFATHAEAQSFILSKVADLNTPIPSGSGNFDSFYNPVISGSNIAFEGYGLSNQEGIYLFDGFALTKVADRNTPIPGGIGNFTNVFYPVISGSNVAFWAQGGGIYLFKNNTLIKLADPTLWIDKKKAILI